MTCYKCGSDEIIKNGKNANGYQRYRCKSCGHTFVSGTVDYTNSASTSKNKQPSKSGQHKKVQVAASGGGCLIPMALSASVAIAVLISLI